MIDSTYKNANILIVDDKESNIEILEDLLEESGYFNVKSITDPRMVFRLIESFKPDLILLDLMMPHINGFEVMEQLTKMVPVNTFLPVLVLTADTTIATKQRALSVGANDFVSKPFNLLEVGLRIKNLLETRYLYQQLENQNEMLEDKVRERTYELGIANQELNKANQELMVLDKAKDDFLNLISHEIRTPINGIKGFTEILKLEIQSPELLEYLQYLEESALRLEMFCYKALLITQLRTDGRKIRFKEVSIDEMIDKTTNQLLEKVNTKGISFHRQTDLTQPVIFGDAELLEFCFESLIDNAIKYSTNNDSVTIKVFTENQHTICEFIDNGAGFSESALENIFTIFGLASKHIDNNTGLNMVLIKLIMDFHKGQIVVKNNELKGAAVRLSFPA